MRVAKALLLLASAIPVHLHVRAQTSGPTNCNYYNVTMGPFPYGSVGYQEYTSGAHSRANSMTGACTYTGSAIPAVITKCTGAATANSDSNVSEHGILNVPLKAHFATYKNAQGVASANGGVTVKADAEGAAGVNSCVGSCSLSITITGSGDGSGFSVAFTPVPIWSDQVHYTNTCAGESLPPVQCSPSGSPPYAPSEGYTWQWNSQSCTWVQVPNQVSPIIIDTKGTGFHFTDPAKGRYVTFDMRGDGQFEKVAWPQTGSGNAWLALDRDGDGIIKDGGELFGNFSPHSDGGLTNHPNPNGFLALDWYDQPAQGGDMNLIVDDRDAIWPKLRLWIDEHCFLAPDVPCQSLPHELHTLDSLGVHSLSLIYGSSPRIDSVGNVYKFYAVVNPEAHDTPVDPAGFHCCNLHQRSKDGRLMYDIYLKQTQ